MATLWASFELSNGTKVFFRVSGHTLENVIDGHMSLEVATRLQVELDRVERQHGKFVGFHHWLHAPSYDPDFRNSWMTWLRQKKGTLLETHFLTQSRLVRMGLAVANIAYSHTKFVVHDTEPSYLAARDAFMSVAAIPEK